MLQWTQAIISWRAGRHCRVILSLSECTGTSELPAFERALVVEAPVGWWLVRGWPNPDGRNPVPFDFFFGNFETLWILGLFHRIIPNLSTGAGFWNPQQTWGLSLHPWTGHFHNLLSSTGTMEWQRLLNTAKSMTLMGLTYSPIPPGEPTTSNSPSSSIPKHEIPWLDDPNSIL